jgi:hypothetical protein
MRNRFPREFYIPAGAVKVTPRGVDGLVFYLYESQGRPCAVAFQGKADKPSWRCWFRTPASREAQMARTLEAHKARQQYMAERAATRKAFVHSVKEGDIFRTCWGYDQTNVEFFEVVEVKGKHAILREVETVSEARGSSERCVPQSGKYCGAPIRRLIQDGRIKISECRQAWPWGQRVAGVVVGEACSRTAAGWGH